MRRGQMRSAFYAIELIHPEEPGVIFIDKPYRTLGAARAQVTKFGNGWDIGGCYKEEGYEVNRIIRYTPDPGQGTDTLLDKPSQG